MIGSAFSQGIAYSRINLKKRVTSLRFLSTSFQSKLPEEKSNNFYVVSTVSRGLGLEFARQLLDRTTGNVIGLARTSQTEGIQELQNKHPNRFHVVDVDLESQESVEAAGKLISGLSSSIDALFNVAGLLGDGGVSTPGPERSIAKMDREWLRKTMEVCSMWNLVCGKNWMFMLVFSIFLKFIK
jgi:NAD(P)-dependent dehydrogenase (short-subunit alcohol dehydrogenase family)